jgi:hypothetical protein
VTTIGKFLGANEAAALVLDERLLVQALTDTFLPKLLEGLRPALAVAESPLLCRDGFKVVVEVSRREPAT